ncbi:MAG: hypothetical protein P4L45_07545 [Ignavibacteriaceae bacterium]|nr:hypothetical protein [Ignavibacteriaceae bacterium]
MNKEEKDDIIIRIAGKVKNECINAALEAYAAASGDGLCCEGAWECAINAIKNINIPDIINSSNSSQ